MASEKGRIEAFSDGIFGIAATLLVFQIKIPPAGQNLAANLLKQWPSYFAFVLSFIFIGIMWVNHHRLFTLIRKADDGLLVINLLLLLGVTVVPFPTSVLAAHLATPNARTATFLYNGTYLVTAILFNILWHYILHRGLLDQDRNSDPIRNISRQYALGPILYLVCFTTTYYSVRLSLLLNTALAIFYTIPASRATYIRAR